jgi:hypothetical protein
VSELFADDRWYGPRYVESIDDTVDVIAGRILRDLKLERDHHAQLGTQPVANPVPKNTAFTIAVIGNTITVTVFLATTKKVPTDYLDKVRNRVMTIADRYNWRGKTNSQDRRFYLRASVKPTTISLHGLVSGALIG